MKKFIANANPFMLLLLPLAFAVLMSVGLNKTTKNYGNNVAGTCVKATSLFSKSVTVFKAVCAISKEKLW